jgi:hypothetical protein
MIRLDRAILARADAEAAGPIEPDHDAEKTVSYANHFAV